MTHIISGMPSSEAEAYRNGAPDAYGNAPEQGVSSGSGVPCRHSMKTVPKGAALLVFAYRPFEGLHPYAETGPVFLCKDACNAPAKDSFPEVLEVSPTYLIKGYTSDQRIKYGTGAIVSQSEAQERISKLLDFSDLSFIDVRSAKNNCWLARVTRA